MSLDTARENLATARIALIALERQLPPNLAEMTSRQAWDLYCALRDIEVAEQAIVEAEDADTAWWRGR